MTTTLITGANRGIGLSLARQLKDNGHTVIGTARDPAAADELRAVADELLELDQTDDASVDVFAKAVGDRPVDILINNAATAPRRESLGEIDIKQLLADLDTNVAGPTRVAQALLPNLRRGDAKKLVHISSICGSIAEQFCTGFPAYDASEAALNMLGVLQANQLRDAGFTVLLLHPGHVRTRMGGDQAPVTPDQSAAGLIEVILNATLADSGAFRDYTGATLPW